MSEREKLREQVVHEVCPVIFADDPDYTGCLKCPAKVRVGEIEGAPGCRWAASKVADAVIRLVVEACCDIAESWTPEGVYAAEEIRSTFLPTTKDTKP